MHPRPGVDAEGPVYGPPAPSDGVVTSTPVDGPGPHDSLAMPAVPGDVVGELGPDLEGAETIEQIRARLAARGLLRESTTPLPDLPITLPPRARPTSEFEEASRSILEDEVDELDYPPAAAPMTLGAAQCPACNAWVGAPGDWTGFRCRSCERSWRWGICGSCDQLSLTPEKQESWRCQLCGHFTRSWWQAPAPGPHRRAVIDRRKRILTRLEEQKRRAEKRHNRRMYIAAGVLALILLTIGGVAAVRRPPSASDVGNGVCAQFTRLKSDIVNGSASRDQVGSRIDALAKSAKGAPSAIASAAEGLKSAGPPGTAQFLVAQTTFSDACDAG